MLHTITDDCGYTYSCTSLLNLYRQMLVIMERVNFGESRDFKITSEPNTTAEQLANIFANSPLKDKPRIELAEVPTKARFGDMLACLRKQAARKEMGMFQYLTWADCQANGDVMPTMVLLIHKPDFDRLQANDILPLDICTIEDVEDWAFEHNRKEDASWCVVPATWNGTQWTTAGVFSEQEWMTKSGWIPAPAADKHALRWMSKCCVRYCVHQNLWNPSYPGERGQHIATYYGQGQLLAALGTWGYNDTALYVERWDEHTGRFVQLLRTQMGHYRSALETNSPVEDLDSKDCDMYFC
jgi:hypothetical protein